MHMTQATYRLKALDPQAARDLADDLGIYSRPSIKGAAFIDLCGGSDALSEFRDANVETPEEEEETSSGDEAAIDEAEELLDDSE